MTRTTRRPLLALATVVAALASVVPLAAPAEANAPLRQQESTTSVYCIGTTDDGRDFNLYVHADRAAPEVEADLSVATPDSEDGGQTWFGTGVVADGVVDVRVPVGPEGAGPVAVFTGTYRTYGDPIRLRDHLRMDNWTLNGTSVFQPLVLDWTTFEPSAFRVGEMQCDAMSHVLDDRWSQPHRTVVREGQASIEVGADCAQSPVSSVALYPAEVQYLMVVTTADATGFAFVSPDLGTSTGQLQWVLAGTDEIASTTPVTVTMARAGRPRHTTTATGTSTVVTTTTPQALGISTVLANGSPWTASCSADVVTHHFSGETPAAG